MACCSLSKSIENPVAPQWQASGTLWHPLWHPSGRLAVPPSQLCDHSCDPTMTKFPQWEAPPLSIISCESKTNRIKVNRHEVSLIFMFVSKYEWRMIYMFPEVLHARYVCPSFTRVACGSKLEKFGSKGRGGGWDWEGERGGMHKQERLFTGKYIWNLNVNTHVLMYLPEWLIIWDRIASKLGENAQPWTETEVHI